MRVLGCSAYVFLHEDQRQNSMSPHAELMTFIGFTDGIKGWKFMKSNNKIFYATKAVFDENTFLHCPNGSRASIPGIETGLLPFDEQNIPPEEENGDSNDDTNRPPPPVERDTLWKPSNPRPYEPTATGTGPSLNLNPSLPPYTMPLPESRPSSTLSDMYVGDDKKPFSYDDPFYASYGYPKMEPSPPVSPPRQGRQLGWNEWVTEFNSQTPAQQARL